jgi:hypothetical protein
MEISHRTIGISMHVAGPPIGLRRSHLGHPREHAPH